jgi:U3 small nucleolar RNA-associated protein 3
LLKKVRDAALPTSPGISYLEAKFHLLLSYCINICFYLLRKAEGKSVKDHPVIHQLVRIRTILEKLRPLDSKLKYQIEKLLKMSTLGATDVAEGAAAIDERLAHRPNLKAFAPKADDKVTFCPLRKIPSQGFS